VPQKPPIELTSYCAAFYKRALVNLKRMPEKDRRLVQEFDHRCTADGLSPGTKANYISTLIRVREALGKPFKNATREDIETTLVKLAKKGYSDNTLALHRIQLKRFYKWLLGNDENYPPVVKWIKTRLKNNHLPYESLLNNNDIEKLAKACTNPRDRAIVLVLAESGVRIGELLNLKVGGVRFDEYGAIATVSGKTGDRAVRLIASAPALATWLDHHPDRDNPRAPLLVNSKRGTPLSYFGAHWTIKTLAKRAGIRKRVHPHGFRHSAATRLSRLLTEAEMKQYLGWAQNSKMAGVYVHLSSRDVDKSMLRIHGLITEEQDHERKFTTIKCPRCSHSSSIGTELCAKCGLPLTFEAAKEIDEKLAMRRALLAKIEKSPKFKELKGVLDALVEEALTK